MLDSEKGKLLQSYGWTEGFEECKRQRKHSPENFRKLLDYYKDLTGYEETNHNAIMHHFIDLYGPDCENCGKPYRTKTANFCSKCGNKKQV